jgi:hypothetical protein
VARGTVPADPRHHRGEVFAVIPAKRLSWQGATGLAEDMRRYGKWIRDGAEKRVGHMYPKFKISGMEATVIWARTVTCPNPACAGTMSASWPDFPAIALAADEWLIEMGSIDQSGHVPRRIGAAARAEILEDCQRVTSLGCRPRRIGLAHEPGERQPGLHGTVGISAWTKTRSAASRCPGVSATPDNSRLLAEVPEHAWSKLRSPQPRP